MTHTTGFQRHFLPSNHPYFPRQQIPSSLFQGVSVIGNIKALNQPKVALLCSSDCPGDLLIKSYDLAHYLRRYRVPVISGFHSPVEEHCLGILLKGLQPVLICRAKSIHRMRIPVPYKRSLKLGRLTILSPFSEHENRTTARTAYLRNRFVTALSQTVLITHARPESKTEKLAIELLDADMPLYTLKSPHNRELIRHGAMTLDLKAFQSWMEEELPSVSHAPRYSQPETSRDGQMGLPF